MTLSVLDLFSGIGGFSLGLERAGGFRTVAFCEIDPFCRRVLARHWPGVPCYDDVRTLAAERLGADGISVDVIAGGFPCQDISVAGRGAGIGGRRVPAYTRACGHAGMRTRRHDSMKSLAAIYRDRLRDGCRMFDTAESVLLPGERWSYLTMDALEAAAELLGLDWRRVRPRGYEPQRP